MSKFRKDGGKPVPSVNTSSLPDIVFMLLFFFMVATTTKESDPTVKVERPVGIKATDMTPYKQRSEIDFLYLGKPSNPARAADFKMGYALFLDNVVQPASGELYNTNAISRWKQDKYDSKPPRMDEKIENVITCIKADRTAPTILIFDIRDQLEKVDALTVAYAVDDKGVF
ncbi:MAG: biopolymer transporter ExbD [Crocinitomicaceae bacterium]|nr:biopolymer transporter ExbD [Crocinitomicaceae bacterium]